MNNPFAHSAARIPTDSWSGRLAARSAKAASQYYYGERPPHLRVQLLNGDSSSWSTSRVIEAMQRATAKIGRLINNPATSDYRVLKRYRDNAKLDLVASSRGMLVFGFPEKVDLEPLREGFDGIRTDTLAEHAALELVSMLPTSDGDSAMLHALLARRQGERSAVNELVKVVNQISAGLGMVFEPRDGEGVLEPVILSTLQAQDLSGVLRREDSATDRITVQGFLDGMRTKRRLFYIQPAHGNEIHGAIDDSMLAIVRQNMSTQVEAELERHQAIDLAGRRQKPTYRLLSLRSVEQLDL